MPDRRPPARPPQARPQPRSTPPEVTQQVVEGGMTLERLGRGIAQVVTAMTDLSGKVDRAIGSLEELREILHELRVALPEPDRWCPPWVSDEGEVYCPGGYKLARSKLGRAKGGKEWMHPLEPGAVGYSWNPEAETWVTATWHSVYESRAMHEPPPEGERPWPQREGAEALPEDERPF